MAKKIQLTLEELKHIVHECMDSMFISERKGECKTFKDVIDYNLYVKDYITEMALHKKDFVGLLLDLKDQLIENWRLCAYCSLYDKANENFDHWLVEFSSYANKIKRCNLKSGDKSKVIYNTYVEKFDLNDSNMVYRIIRGKFNREGLDDETAKTISEFCAQNIVSIINLLSCDGYETEEYIMRTFM